MTARRLFFVATTAAAWVLASAPGAGAIPNTCPTSGPDAAIVNINEPPAGNTFAGQVTVRGRASAAAGLTRVELLVGEALKDFQVFEPSKPDVEFLLRFDVASVRSDRATLSVVACGGTSNAPVRGIASIDVRVDRAAVVTAPPMAVTPIERRDDPVGTGRGPAWVGAAFGLAGLAGLVAATRVRPARGASAPSPAAAPAKTAPPPQPGRDGDRRPDRPPVARGDGPPRPSPARPDPTAAAGPGASPPAAGPATAGSRIVAALLARRAAAPGSSARAPAASPDGAAAGGGPPPAPAPDDGGARPGRPGRPLRRPALRPPLGGGDGGPARRR